MKIFSFGSSHYRRYLIKTVTPWRRLISTKACYMSAHSSEELDHLQEEVSARAGRCMDRLWIGSMVVNIHPIS